jgi:valyl-tRNA synthetase
MSRTLASEPLLAGRESHEAAKRASAIYASAGKLRNLKAEYNVASRRDVRFVVKGAPGWLSSEKDVLALLAGAGEIDLDDGYESPQGTPAALTDVGEVAMPLDGLIDVEAERERLGREIEKIRGEVKKSEGKLGNASFVERAPAAVVDQEKARLDEWREKLGQLEEMVEALR